MWKVKTADVWGNRYQTAAFNDESVQSNRKTALALESSALKLLNSGFWKRKIESDLKFQGIKNLNLF